MSRMLPKIFLLFLPDFVKGESVLTLRAAPRPIPLLEYDKIKDKHEGLRRRRLRPRKGY